MKQAVLAAKSGILLSALLMAAPAFAQGAHVDANGMPTNDSTPQERAQTAQLNGQTGSSAAANNAQYQAQQEQYRQQQQDYQQKLQENQAQQQQYQDRRAAYDALRARYRAERAAYHRGEWPDRYARWTLDDSDHLTGQRVEILGGDRVGTVVGAAHTGAGRVEGLEVALDNGKTVWIDREDVRYDRGDRTVVTNLDRHDLYLMADERM